MGALTGIFHHMDWMSLLLFIMSGAACLISLTVHELSHGLAAYRLGDPTAKLNGRLTLNPLSHIDWIGLFLLLAVGVGWAKPVPVDPRNFREPRKGMAITALAGPLSNFVLALVSLGIGSLLFHFGPANRPVAYLLLFLCQLSVLNVGLGLFNLIPIPPLDGSRVVEMFLPERAYTPDQYRLIFRHELRHVQRRDVDTKCFYIFCKALCWFNPLVWIALNRAAADLELSCDEMVVYGAEEDTRKEYAALLLDCAGDARGLSTCLSASASSLRRRLKGVVAPGERTAGTKLLAGAMAALALCSGLVGVSFRSGSLGEVVLPDYPAPYSVSLRGEGPEERVEEPDPQVAQALLDYLSPLPVTRLATGQQVWGSAQPVLTLYFPGGWFFLTDGLCSIQDPMADQVTSVLYRVDAPVDWAYLRSLLEG